MIKIKLMPCNAEENARILLDKAISGEEVEISNWEELQYFFSLLEYHKIYDVMAYRQYDSGRIVEYDYDMMHHCLSHQVECRPLYKPIVTKQLP